MFKIVEIAKKIKGVLDSPNALRTEEKKLYKKIAGIPKYINIDNACF